MSLCDVGILTIKIEELRAVLAAFPTRVDVGPPFTAESGRQYNLRQADAGNGETYRVAIMRMSEQGNGAAQDATRDMLDDLRPRLVLVVGIAGARPSMDITLGDVFIATRINDYTVHAETKDGTVTYALGGGALEKQIVSGIVNLAAREQELGDWSQGLPARPLIDTANLSLHGPEDWQKSIRESLAYHFETEDRQVPRFRDGVMGSSDGLIANPEILIAWLQTARNLQALEMEAAGVYKAAGGRCAWASIRGISDIVGHKRSEQWLEYACRSAAHFARAYLQTTPIPSLPPGTPYGAGYGRGGSGGTGGGAGGAGGSGGGGGGGGGGDGGGGDVTQTGSVNIAISGAGNPTINVTNVVGDVRIILLNALETLVENGVADVAMVKLAEFEAAHWGESTASEKSRHRKLLGRTRLRVGDVEGGASAFMEAFDYTPMDEKSQYVKGIALKLRGNVDGAHAYFEEILERFPNLMRVRAAWIATAPSIVAPEDLLAPPWERLDGDVAAALAHRLMMVGRTDEAMAVLENAGTALSFDGLFELTAARLSKVSQLEKLSSGQPELNPLLRRVALAGVEAAEAAALLLRGQGMVEPRKALYLNAANLYFFLKDEGNELLSINRALEVAPQAHDVIMRKAAYYAEREDYSGAAVLLEAELARAENPGPARILLAQVLYRRGDVGDYERALALFRETLSTVADSDVAYRREMEHDAALGVVSCERVLLRLEDALASAEKYAAQLGPSKAARIRARILIGQGEPEAAARSILPFARSSDVPVEDRRELGVMLFEAGDLAAASTVLEHVADLTRWDASANALLRAAATLNQNELVVRTCRTLRSNGVVSPAVTDIECVALAKRGEFTQAIEVVQRHLAVVEDAYLRLRLSMLGKETKQPSLVESDPSRLPKLAPGAQQLAVMVVDILKYAGRFDVALTTAYAYYRANREDPFAWEAIITAFVPDGPEFRHVEPTVVGVGAAVLVREGKQQRWIVVEEDNPDPHHDEYAPSHPHVAPMMGLAAGQGFSVTRAPLPDRVYSIVEIRSKEVRRYHECLERWEQTFPTTPGPRMIDVPDEADKMLEELRPLLAEKERDVARLNAVYRSTVCSLHMLATFLGGSDYETHQHIIATEGMEYRCSQATPRLASLARDAFASGAEVVIETSALSTQMLLGGDILGALGQRLRVARSTLDAFDAYVREHQTTEHGMVFAHRGAVQFREVSADARAKQLERLGAFGKLVRERCSVFDEPERQLLEADKLDSLASIGGAGFVESLHYCLRTGATLWTDDQTLALLADQLKARSIWTQMMAVMLQNDGTMSAQESSSVTAKLVGWRYVSTQLAPMVFVEAVKLSEWTATRWPVREHLALITREAWTSSQLLSWLVPTIRETWRATMLETQASTIIVALLEAVNKRVDAGKVLRLLPSLLEVAFGLDVVSFGHVFETVDAWVSSTRGKA